MLSSLNFMRGGSSNESLLEDVKTSAECAGHELCTWAFQKDLVPGYAVRGSMSKRHNRRQQLEDCA